MQILMKGYEQQIPDANLLGSYGWGQLVSFGIDIVSESLAHN